MCNGKLPNGDAQLLYFNQDHPSMPSWFKGMETIIRERGLWPERGLAAQCADFHCPPGRTDCCCQQLLFTQPDFEGQRSQLQEFIEGCRHICNFYPKYHCKLNFIEQYWGVAKFRYRAAPRATTIANMEKTVRDSLDSAPLQIQQLVLFFLSCLHLILFSRFANRSASFITAYREGLSGAQASWANKRYHSHHTLPPQCILNARNTVNA
jgi:hypothetical protein